MNGLTEVDVIQFIDKITTPNLHRYTITWDLPSRSYKISEMSSQIRISEEVYEWLLENVGYQFYDFREHDRVYYTWPQIKSSKEMFDSLKTFADWNIINPIIPEEKRRWFISGSGRLWFKNAEDAVLFKLKWA